MYVKGQIVCIISILYDN